MLTKTDRILSYLPVTFQTLPKPTALHSVVDAFGNELLLAENSLAAFMLAHWVDYADRGADDIEDLAKFAALYGLAPRPDETVEEFRQHLKRFVRTYLEGPVTVQGILRIVAENLGLQIADDYLDMDRWWFRKPYNELVNTNDRRFITRAYITGEAASAVFGFPAQEVYGGPATRAKVIGKVDLSRGIDLRQQNLLYIKIDDNQSPVPIDCAGPRPRATLPEEIVAAINNITNIASFDGRHLVLTSRTEGALSRIAFETGDADARMTLFGEVPDETRGTDITSAILTGEVDLLRPVDLSYRRTIKLAVNGEAGVEIDIAGAAPNATFLDEIVTQINQAFPELASATEDDRLRLMSPVVFSKGKASSIELLPTRALEIIEFPVTWVENPSQLELHHAGRWVINNDGAADVNAEISLTTKNGVVCPELVNLSTGMRMRVLGILRPGEQLQIKVDSEGIPKATLFPVIEQVDRKPKTQFPVRSFLDTAGSCFDKDNFDNAHFARLRVLPDPDPLGARFDCDLFDDGHFQIHKPVLPVVPLQIRPLPNVYGSRFDRDFFDGAHFVGDAKAALTLPRGRSQWTFLECHSARFDEAKFSFAKFPGEACDQLGIFDLSQFPGTRDMKELPVFADNPSSWLPNVQLSFRWPRHQPGAFTVNLPADLPERFGGRFDQARFAGANGQPAEKFPNVVTEPDDDPDYIVTQLKASKLVQASYAAYVAMGFRAVTLPFRREVRLSHGGDEEFGRPAQTAKLFLAEKDVEGFILIEAIEPGAWGNGISITARKAGPARFDLTISYQGACFENARDVVLGGGLLPVSVEKAMEPGPYGVLQGKAVGVEINVTRDKTN